MENNDADCQCELLKALYEILSEEIAKDKDADSFRIAMIAAEIEELERK